MAVKHGNLSINSENIFPIIKKWLYSDHDIFVRELVSNGCDAITKLKKLEVMGEYTFPEGYKPETDRTISPFDKVPLPNRSKFLRLPPYINYEFYRPKVHDKQTENNFLSYSTEKYYLAQRSAHALDSQRGKKNAFSSHKTVPHTEHNASTSRQN